MGKGRLVWEVGNSHVVPPTQRAGRLDRLPDPTGPDHPENG